MVIYPESFSLKPDTEATVPLRNLFNTASTCAVDKNLTFSRGKYVFQSKNAAEREICISNTVAESEYAPDEKKNMRKIAVDMNGVKNIDIDCNGSVFIMDGKMTALALTGCENVLIKNLEIYCVLPDVHKVTVVKATPFFVTFKIDETSNYCEENGEYYWYGTDYKTSFFDGVDSGFWIVTARPGNDRHILRNGEHPFSGIASFKETSDRTFTARFVSPKDYEPGQVFYFFPVRREQVGILVDGCKNIRFENIKMNYSPSLAFIAQNSENITLEKFDFSPDKDAEIDFCSRADFLQFSMCRGRIAVRNSNFDAAGDDVCNVHGFHFKIMRSEGNRLTVRFEHPQSYGFQCFREGDEIAFIDPKTLCEVARSQIISAKLYDGYYYDLLLSTFENPLGVGGCIENLSACPDFEFSGNTVNRIVTRGVLATTRGKILIENNKFLNTGMSGVLISDDANYWYESGCVKEAVIRSNAFMNCDENCILIKPEIDEFDSFVHQNILIENNLFMLHDTNAVNASYSKDIVLRGNIYRGAAKNSTANSFLMCAGVVDDEQK